MSAPTPLERLARGEDPACEPEYAPELYWMWLAALLRPGFAHTGLVLRAYGGAKQVWQQRYDTERFAAVAGTAAAKRLAKADSSPEEFAPVLRRCKQRGIHVIPFDRAAYPAAMANLGDAPPVLYATGDIRYLNTAYTVGMVGSRKPSPYGVEAAARLGGTIAQSGAAIVSGLADGLDSEAHKAAVEHGAPTIAVLGVPIHRTYPAGNEALRRKIEAHGVVVSEYPPTDGETHPSAFLLRNRIIAGLSSALLVVEARQRSGTMSTVAHAERYGRPVYAVPGSIFSNLSQGTNQLLESGRARPAVTGREILQAIGLPVEKAAPPTQQSEPEAPALTEPQRRVLEQIGPDPVGLGALMGKTGLAMGALLGALTSLEMAGCIIALPGRQYKLK